MCLGLGLATTLGTCLGLGLATGLMTPPPGVGLDRVMDFNPGLLMETPSPGLGGRNRRGLALLALDPGKGRCLGVVVPFPVDSFRLLLGVLGAKVDGLPPPGLGRFCEGVKGELIL